MLLKYLPVVMDLYMDGADNLMVHGIGQIVPNVDQSHQRVEVVLVLILNHMLLWIVVTIKNVAKKFLLVTISQP